MTNVAGHLAALSIAITDTLPAGFAYSSTDAVTLSGGATRSSVTNPTEGQTVPSWGGFDIPAGGSVGITFSATHSGGALGLIGNSVQAGASYFGLTVASKYSDTDGTADDVTLADPVSTVFAHTMVEQLTSAAVTTTADELWSTDARTITTGAFPVTADPKRYLDVDYRAPVVPVQSPSMQPQPASVSVVLAMAAPNVAAKSCVTIQVGSATTAVFHTAIATPVCVTGTTVTQTTVVLPLRTWAGSDFSDLRVRLTGTSSASLGTVVDQVGVSVSWQGSTFRLQPTSSIDASSGVAAGAKVARGVSGDAVSLTTGGTTAIATTFSSLKYIDLQVPAEIPAGATVGTVRGTFRWSTDTSATACWYLDVRTGGARVGGVGTSGTSTCHAGANVASSDTLVFPALTLAQVNDLTARIYFKTTSGSAKTVSVDQFSLDITWSRP